MKNLSNSPYNNSLPLNDENIELIAKDGIKGWFDQGFTWLVYTFAGMTVAVLFVMSWIVFQEARPAIAKFGIKFLWGQNWDVNNEIFGALPYIYGTLVSSAIAIIFAFPVGLAVALVTSENFVPVSIQTTLAFVVQLIAAIPSVIVGLWGIFIFIPVLEPLQKWIAKYFSWIPLFNTTDPFGTNMLTAGIILAIMILPTIAAISREVLLAIPKELRSASMALGSTRWETIFRVLLPAGFSGIVSATMLALGRALGETMAVTMVIGNSAQISASLLDPAYTIPSVIANEFAEANPGLHIGALTYLGLVLFAVTLAVNIGAVLLIQLVGKKNR
ncbi:phosphate ABC transporter permease subunit PstC [Nodularia spumigena CS-584]|jgi:phosphate transport system permease protein|uniref:Phosphate transport system permease protein n=2 Tax=Nodularia spumigena TaxID=70799 RepID=A0A2S0QAQ5_NODSP|nr:phosphate ABC transporter permease subunit PstC [Nodularia spumigena]AHJ29219.1 Phosphate transport system permease protein PstC [Nodularia spumigena CCY9414]AVZ31451.1 phosphate transport system permease protein PstC [Nodularia spumigena UHCC 0039]EAW43238.1 ABC phosphate transport system permease protein [Nodularia spumigena CCY9414]MDB9384834.1 phosphate ABC transporter permease subunit PstC [Nodularia spumigena CS-584]MEA5527618.1 phosphate ABC transporter permease subunit PstC [Nodular